VLVSVFREGCGCKSRMRCWYLSCVIWVCSVGVEVWLACRACGVDLDLNADVGLEWEDGA